MYTTDGKEYLTHKQLRAEIRDELLLGGGRLAMADAQAAINVDVSYVSEAAEAVAEADDTIIRLENGELVCDYYLDQMVDDIGDDLAEKGMCTLAGVASSRQLPVAFVTSAVQERLGKRLDAELRDGALYTRSYVDRQQAQVRGAFAALTKPAPVAAIAGEHGLDTRTLDGVLNALIEGGGLNGVVRGGNYVPHLFAAMQRRSTEAFFKQNGYMSKDRAGVLDIPASQLASYLRSAFPGCIELDTCVVSETTMQRVEGNVDEVVATGSWVDARTVVPSNLSESDVTRLVASVSRVGGEWVPGAGSDATTSKRRGAVSRVAMALADVYIVSYAFLDKMYKLCEGLGRSAAEAELQAGAKAASSSTRGGAGGADSPQAGSAAAKSSTEDEEAEGFVVVSAPTVRRQKSKSKGRGAEADNTGTGGGADDSASASGKGGKKKGGKAKRAAAAAAALERQTSDATEDADWSSDEGSGRRGKRGKKGKGKGRRGKGGPSGAGNSGGPSKAARDTSEPSGAASASTSTEDVATKLPGLLMSWSSDDAPLSDCPELVEALTATLAPAVASLWDAIRTEVFASAVHGRAAARRKAFAELRPEVEATLTEVVCFEEGWRAFAKAESEDGADGGAGGAEGESVTRQFERHLLHTVCTAVTDRLIMYHCHSADGVALPEADAEAAVSAGRCVDRTAQPVFQQATRTKLLAALRKHAKPGSPDEKTVSVLTHLSRAAARGTLDEWFEHLDGVASQLELRLGRTDVCKKADRRRLAFGHAQAIGGELKNAATGANVLRLTLLALLQQAEGAPLLIPDDTTHWAAVLSRLSEHTSAEVQGALTSFSEEVDVLRDDGDGAAPPSGGVALTKQQSAESVTAEVERIRSIGLRRALTGPLDESEA